MSNFTHVRLRRVVEQIRPARADWRIMSPAYPNLVQREGKKLSEDYLNLMTKA